MGLHFVQCSSPVGKLTTFRAMLAESARRKMDWCFIDIASAYLTSSSRIRQYTRPPPGVSPPEVGMVWRLDRCLYGLKDSGRAFHLKFRKDLIEWGFKASEADPCLFIKRHRGEVLRVLLFVDDMAVFNDSTAAGRAMKERFMKAITDKGYKYSAQPDDNVYLGLTVKVTKNGFLVLTQERYIGDLAAKYEMTQCSPVNTPQPGGQVTVKDCPATDPKENTIATSYRELCGALRWIEQCTRPDISASLSELAKVQINPGQVHMKRLRHLLRYVITTSAAGIVYGGKKGEAACGPCVGYVDSDWAGDPDTFYTLGGWVVTAWGSPICWASYKIKSVACSSCEAEYQSAAQAVRELTWLRHLFSDMGYGDLTPTSYGKLCSQDYEKSRLADEVDEGELPVMLLCDNKGAVAISANSVLHKRSKHIHIVYHVVRREVNKKHVRLNYINTKANLADLMTKGLKAVDHGRLTRKLLSLCVDGELLDFVTRQPLAVATTAPIRDQLYEHEPLGLIQCDVLLPKIRCVCDYDRMSDGEQRGLEMREAVERGVGVSVPAKAAGVFDAVQDLANLGVIGAELQRVLQEELATETMGAIETAVAAAVVEVAELVALEAMQLLDEHIVETRRLPISLVRKWQRQL